MTEVVIDTDTRGKRRLPSWMLQVSSPDGQGNCENGDKTCSLLIDQPEGQASGSKTKPTTGKRSKRIITEDTDGLGKLDLLQRCEAKQRTRKTSRRGLGPDNLTLGEVKKKRKEEVNGWERMLDYRDAPKKKKQKSKRSKNGDLVVPSQGDQSEDEIELTVEDLVNIAEEYVNADREKQYERSVTIESHSETHPSNLSASHDDSGRPLQAAGSGKILSKCTATRSSSYLNNTERSKEKGPGVENFATNIKRTGDAAQDMLDLFLGPLLKKPPAIEQENGAIKAKSMNVTDETDNKQARNREMSREEGTLMLTKKKSSLKDKVAMFLD